MSLLPVRALLDAAATAQFVVCAALLTLALALADRLLRRTRWFASRAVRAALAALVFVGAWRANQAPPPDVVLVVLDSLRAQNVSAWGYERATTPELDAFAARHGVRLTQFVAQAAETDKALPAILAGIQPSSFYDPARDGADFSLPPELPLLAELLRARGYRGYGLSTNPKIRAELGYARGFERFEALWDDAPRPAAVFERLTRELRHARGRPGGPFFHFALVLDPHMPYEPEPEFRFGEFESSRQLTKAWSEGSMDVPALQAAALEVYDGEIRETDAALGGYLRALEEDGALANTLVVITADHGEKFWEHGQFGHGGELLEEVLHIPAVLHVPSPLRIPDLRTEARTHDALASQVDLLPTILAAVGGAPPPAGLPGRDLRGELRRGPTRTAHARTVLAEQLEPARSLRCLRGPAWKLEQLEHSDAPPRVRFTELVEPPASLPAWVDRADAPRAWREHLAELDRRTRRARERYVGKPAVAAPDEETRRRLEAIGYAQG